MADTKISALTDVVTLAAGDKVPVADASDLTASKSATMTELAAYISTQDQITNTTAIDTLITAGNSSYYPMFMEIGSGFNYEIGSGSYLEIG